MQYYTIDNVNFNRTNSVGVEGTLTFVNGYGVVVSHNQAENLYSITFLKKKSEHAWTVTPDANMLTISPNGDIFNLSREEVNLYIQSVQDLTNE